MAQQYLSVFLNCPKDWVTQEHSIIVYSLSRWLQIQMVPGPEHRALGREAGCTCLLYLIINFAKERIDRAFAFGQLRYLTRCPELLKNKWLT
jgi:hypothetical protein